MPEANLLTRAQVRNVDKLAIETYGMDSLVLMENAARGCVDHLPGDGPVVIACGKGNNGGDGFAIARHLDNQPRACHVFLFGNESELSPDAAANWRLLQYTDVERSILPDGPDVSFTQAISDAEWVLDALLGTGVTGSIRAPFDAVIDSINQHAKQVAAVDIPSGLDCDTGETLGPCVKADRTWTFVAPKVGFPVSSGPTHIGEIFTVDIGVPGRIIREAVSS